MKKVVAEYLDAQENYERNRKELKEKQDLAQRIEYLKENPAEMMRALYCKKLDIDRLVERRTVLTEKIASQFMKQQSSMCESSRRDLHFDSEGFAGDADSLRLDISE